MILWLKFFVVGVNIVKTDNDFDCSCILHVSAIYDEVLFFMDSIFIGSSGSGIFTI